MRSIGVLVCLLVAPACSTRADVGSEQQGLCNCDQTPKPCCCRSPIVIDVAGDGIELTSTASGVMVAPGPDFARSEIAWTEPDSDDAWLVFDRNVDGTINDGTEMFGDRTPQPTPRNGDERNGFLALALFDDGDSMIDKRDHIYEKLRLWQDRDHDGISDPSELHTLPELGVAAISVDYSESRYADANGNAFRYRAAVVGTPGSPVGMSAWDVWLSGTDPEPLAGKGAAEREVAEAGAAAVEAPDSEPLSAVKWWCHCECDVESIFPDSDCPTKVDGVGSGADEDAACNKCISNSQGSLPAYCYTTSCFCWGCYEDDEFPQCVTGDDPGDEA